MPDKNLTDNEIKKALECCADYKNTKCKGCPLEESCVDNNICELALDLINCLQAENERLKEENKNLATVDYFQWEKDLKSEAYKEFAERLLVEIQEAIISNGKAIEEREKKHNANCYEDDFCIMCNGKITALGGIRYFIHNLLKELVGDSDGT